MRIVLYGLAILIGLVVFAYLTGKALKNDCSTYYEVSTVSVLGDRSELRSADLNRAREFGMNNFRYTLVRVEQCPGPFGANPIVTIDTLEYRR
jgi:hypothetical protein